jgi:hypothetical protein
MLDHFIQVAYQHEKIASNDRALIDKLKQLPLDELMKIADGEHEKIAYLDSCSSPGGGSWLEQFKGTPLLEQAIEIERALLENEAQDQARRQESRTLDQQGWDARDQLTLKKRMLELDLVTSQSGGGNEAQEEKGVQMLEQAQAAERAQGEGGEPHEQAEDQAIQQFRQAQSQEAAAKAQEQEQPKPKEEKPKGGMSVEVKQSSATKVAHAVEAGRVLAEGLRKKASENKEQVRAEVAKKFPALAEKKANLTAGLIGAGAGAHKAQSVDRNPVLGGAMGFLGADVGSGLGGQLGATAGMESARVLGLDPVKARALGALLGMTGGGVLGYKSMTGGYKPKPKKEEAEKKAFSLTDKGHQFDAAIADMKARHAAEEGALLQEMGALGGVGSPVSSGEVSFPKAMLNALRFQGSYDDPRGTARHQEYVAKKHRGGENAYNPFGGLLTPSPHEEGGTPGFAGLVGKLKNPNAKTAGLLGGIAKSLPGLAAGAKNLVGTAHAAGGMPQVAKSLGTVATQFAQKNPLAAAGIAGGAGLMAGRATAPSQPRA